MPRVANNIQIKIETNDLQNYLDKFNKEIEEGSRSISNSFVDPADLLNDNSKDNEDDENGTYFVDEAGNYYFQATPDSDPVPTDPPENVQIVGEESDNEIEFKLPSIPKPKSAKTRSQTKSTKTPKNTYVQSTSYILGDDNDIEVDDVNENDEAIAKSGNGNDDDNDENEDYDEDPDEECDENEVFEFDENEESKDDKKKAMVVLSSKIVKVNAKNDKNSSAPHPCPYCEYVTCKRYLLARHMKCHSEERPYKCSVCERGFKTNASLQNHVNTHTGNKPYHCKSCPSVFTTSGELVRHVRYKHTHEKPHKCDECDYASVELSKLRRHIRCHTGERPFQCPYCTYASPDTFKLKRHLRTHTGEKPYECDICRSKFTQSNSLKQHKLIHSVGDKPVFQCHLCPTTCGRKTDLRIHIQKLHTSDQPLTCKRCEKSFPDRYTYKLHSKTHDGEKCFKCDLCPYASISQRHLDSHLLIHSDSKPFVCELCLQAFRQKQLLRRHQNLYHNEEYMPPIPLEKVHSCPDCKRAFSRKGNLMRHMAMHDPDSKLTEEKTILKMSREYLNENSSTQEGHFEVVEGEEEEEEEEVLGDENTVDYELGEEIEEMDTFSETKTTGIANFEEVMIKKEEERVPLDECDDQYMVVEIIQSDDEDENDLPFEADIKDELEDDFVITEFTDEGVNIIKRKNRTEAVEDCFGFSESEELIEESLRSDTEGQGEGKTDIKLLEILQ